MSKSTSVFLFLFLFLSINLFAQTPRTMSYQGILTDASGVIVPDGNYNITVRLYDVQSGGTALWEEAQLILVNNGIFNAVLGNTTPLNLPFNKQYWLGVSVAAGAELTPRVQMTGSPYSLNNSVKIDGVFGNSNNVSLTSTTATEILSLSIPDEGTLDVSLSGYAQLEMSGSGNGNRYEFTIRRGSVTGDVVGRGWWRPGTSAGFQSVTISFNGIDKNVTGPVTYYLCGRKFDGSAPDASTFINGLNATWVLE